MKRHRLKQTPAILQLTDNLEVGGVQRVAVNLANWLGNRRFSVTVAAAPGGPLWGELAEHCRRTYAPKKPTNVLSVAKYIIWLRNLIRTENFDVVHVHQRGVAAIARIACLGTQAVIVEHVHNMFLPVSARLVSFRGHRLIACGPQVAEMLCTSYGRKPERIDVVLNAVEDINAYCANDEPTEDQTIRLICVARATAQKDPEKFVRLVAQLNSLALNTRFEAIWVGDGDLRPKAEQLAKTLKCKEVHFVGSTDNVQAFLAKADFFILTSNKEGLPLAVLEAMSMAKGAIVPDVGSCTTAVKTDVNGLVYDPQLSAERLAEHIAPHLSKATARTWGARSREIYESEFTPERMVDDVVRIYGNVLSERPALDGHR